MTCVAAWIKQNKVYFGGDGLATAEHSREARLDPKIFKAGRMLIGFCGSYRVGQILMHHFVPKLQPKDLDDYTFIGTTILNQINSTLTAGGIKSKYLAENSVSILIGYKSRLYIIHEDWQVGIISDNFYAIGSGAEVALGVLATCKKLNEDNPEQNLTLALEIASNYVNSVGPPYSFLVL